jgi:O-antigen ligase
VLGVLAFSQSAVVSTIFSNSPRTSWRGAYDSHGGLITILGYVVLFFAARWLGGTRRLIAAVVLAATVASAYALMQAAQLDPVVWDKTPLYGKYVRPFGTLGHANLLGAYLAMSLPLLAYLALRAVQRRRWALLVGLMCVAAAAGVSLVLTLSRAAWLAAGCATLILLGCWLRRARRGAAVLLLTLLVVVVAGFVAFEREWLPESVQVALSERLLTIDSGAGRRDIWQAGWQIYGDHPLIGSGLDTFRLAFGTRRTAAFWGDKYDDGTPTKAHNEAIHILATQGSLGGVALLALLAGLVWATVQAWRRTQDRALIAALASSLVAFGVTNMFGFTVIATGSLFAVCAGLLSRFGESSGTASDSIRPEGNWRQWAIPGIVFGSLIVAYVGVIEPLLANLSCRRGDLELAESPSKAASSYQEATRLDPGCDLYYLRLADATRQEALRTGSTDDMRRARTALEQAAALVPLDAYHHANLGRFLGELARTDPSVHEAALAEWRQAAVLEPNNPTILADASRTALVVADFAAAQDYAAHGAELYPSWAIFPAQVGAAALGRGDLSAAVHGLEQALPLDWRDNPEAHGRALAMLASADLRRGEVVRAQEYAKEASVWLPQWPTPHMMRAQALKALDQRDESLREVMIARKLQGLPTGPVNSSASPH